MNYDPRDPRNNQVYPQQTGQPAQPQNSQPGQMPVGQPGMPVTGYAQPPMNQNYPNAQQIQPTAMPQINVVDETMVQQSYAKHKTDMANWGGGDGPEFLSFLGPQGQKRWDASVPVNYEAIVTVYIAPPWAPGCNIFYQNRSHFWKSYSKPQGTSVTCAGADCLVCKAREFALSQNDGALKQRAKDVAGVRTRFYYNVFVLDNVQGHYDSTGQMRPFILQAGSKLHSAIGDMLEARGGAMAIVDPTHGRPLRLKKKKVGPSEMNVEYSLVDLNPMPLPNEFYPALGNLWDLSAMDKEPTQDDMIAAVNDMQLPMPPTAGMQMQTMNNAGGGMPQPQPAYANPYQPQQMVFGGSYPQNQPVQQPTQPSMQQWSQQQMPANTTQPQMQPPAVHSTNVQSTYRPQPSQPNLPLNQAVQPAQTAVQTAPTADPQNPLGNVPAPPSLSQSPLAGQAGAAVSQQATTGARQDGRDRCFGKFDPNSNLCAQCPPELKPQCITIAGQQSAPQGQTVEQLQAQLQGKG